MVRIAGSKKLKRQMAPMFWSVTRKDKRFVITTRPGPHPKNLAIPTAVLLRDTLKLTKTLRESKSAIYRGQVTVDGVKRKSLHHGIGLMDVVELDKTNEVYRMVPKDGWLLKPLKINESEKTKKLVKVIKKMIIKGGKTQLDFHDGRTLISDVAVNVGDTCLIEIPSQKILDVIKLEQGSQVIVIQGLNAGQVGKVEKIEAGSFKLPKRVLLSLEQRQIEIPTEMIMVVGKDKPVIQVR